jgi:hypothetical protein
VQGKKKRREQVEERRAPLDPRKKEEMLAVLIRHEEAFDTAQELFSVTSAKRSLSDGLALVWKVTRDFHKRNGELPARTQIESDVHNELSANEELVDEDERSGIDEFLDFAFDDEIHGKDISKSRSHLSEALRTCQQVLEELLADDTVAKMHADGTLPADLPRLLADAQLKLDAVQSINEADLTEPFPEGWDQQEDAQLRTTGVRALDEFSGGGWRKGEAFLFIAPYGSCKTMLACHSAAELVFEAAALVANGEARRNGKGKLMTPLVVLAFSESDAAEYRVRLLSHLARVPWKRLAQMKSLSSLSNEDHPAATPDTKYEEKEFADSIRNDQPWENEQTRVRRAVKLFNRHLLLVDLTDSENNPNRIGTGGMTDVANVLKSIFRKRRSTHYPHAVWIDHLSGIIDQVSELISDKDVLRTMLTNMPRIAAKKIGDYFGCPVGLLHQFAGSKQSQSPTAAFHHGDAEGSKSIGKYVVFAIVSGSVDGNGMCRWRCTKHRREPPTPVRIVKVDGRFNRLIDCTDTHTVSPGGRLIVPRKQADAMTSTVHDAGDAAQGPGVASVPSGT